MSDITKCLFQSTSQWVLGGIHRRDTKNAFFVCIPDLNSETLLSAIAENVAPGSTIVSNQLPVYSGIANLKGYNYTHLTVNHSKNFVNPSNPSAHTQTIESSWGHVKKIYRQMNGTSTALFPSYLDQFLFKKHYPSPSTFGNLLYWIGHYYPF